MQNKKALNFSLDSMDWEVGVSDNYFSTPLGLLSTPVKIEEIAEVEWTIIQDHLINVIPIDQLIQIKYWLKIPDIIREKIKIFSESIVPFGSKDLKDRYLIAYSIERHEEKYIGFIFESMLKSSKVCIYVYTQARIRTDKEAKIFLEDYLYEIYQRDVKKIQSEEYKMTLSEKILGFFKR